MENKYYTPTIEEFHIGFEYEYRNGDEWKKDILSEFSEEMTPGTLFCNIDGTLTDEGKASVRVKYLDKDDIESLGWKFNDNMSVVSQLYYLYEKDGYDLSVWYRKEGLLLVIRKVNKSSDNIVVHSHSIFYGYIKNKSELKVLLKQLGIE